MASSLNFFPPVIAHRGACAYAPENTMSAFVKAAQLGETWIEFDVMLSSDGVPLVFHDELLDRTSDGRGTFAACPYHYLRSLDAGSWFSPLFAGERIPSLHQVIEFLNNTNISANIELKPLPGQEDALVKKVLKDVTYLSSKHSIILFSSFSIEALKSLRQHSVHSLIGLLMHEHRSDWQEICEALDCVSVHINEKIVNVEFANQIKHLGKKLLCYTVNDFVRAKELYSLGVDALFSDCPDKIL